MKTDKDQDQVGIKNLSKMIHCLSYDVYKKIINMDFSNKVEVLKQYRQSVMNRKNVGFFISVIHKFLELKVRTMAIVIIKIQSFGMGVKTFDFFRNFK